MRKNFGSQPVCFPQPVFIIAAYDENGVPNAMNAAWGGINDTAELFICLSAEHKTVKNMLLKGAFTVSMGTAAHAKECDYLGVVSGNDVPDKFEKSGFHAEKSGYVDAPLICELPMALECTLKSYDPATGRTIGNIVNVCVDESVLGEDGNIDVMKLRPITFDPAANTYRELGPVAGRAFEDGFAL